MMEALVITPVKDSPETVRKTISAITRAEGDFEYIVFNDFSNSETKYFLEENQDLQHFKLINLENYTNTPSPNYKLVLRMGQEMALSKKVPLILIESDVIVNENTVTDLIEISSGCTKPGLIGVATIDKDGNYNFPYSYIKKNQEKVIETSRSLSFCCTLLSLSFLENYDFKQLPVRKDWYDIYISRQSRRLGFHNYLVKDNGVLHLPHSSRPWKQLKYTHPVRYYFFKLLQRRDRI